MKKFIHIINSIKINYFEKICNKHIDNDDVFHFSKYLNTNSFYELDISNALLRCCEKGSIHIAKIIIELNPHLLTNEQYLSSAITHNHLSIAIYMLEQKCNPNIKYTKISDEARSLLNKYQYNYGFINAQFFTQIKNNDINLIKKNLQENKNLIIPEINSHLSKSLDHRCYDSFLAIIDNYPEINPIALDHIVTSKPLDSTFLISLLDKFQFDFFTYEKIIQTNGSFDVQKIAPLTIKVLEINNNTPELFLNKFNLYKLYDFVIENLSYTGGLDALKYIFNNTSLDISQFNFKNAFLNATGYENTDIVDYFINHTNVLSNSLKKEGLFKAVTQDLIHSFETIYPHMDNKYYNTILNIATENNSKKIIQYIIEKENQDVSVLKDCVKIHPEIYPLISYYELQKELIDNKNSSIKRVKI